jgi:hypothetical protein
MPTIGHFSLTYKDRENKSSVQRVGAAVLTAGNIVAQSTAAANLATATDNMSLGARVKTLLGNLTTTVAALPTNNNALRSRKFAVSYHDTTTGDKYTTQIPISNNAAVTMEPGTKLVDLTIDPAAAYVTAFNAFVASEDGNAVLIDQIRATGRHI